VLTIRTEQMEKFSEAAFKSFEDRMISFLAAHFPDQSGTLGEHRVRCLVRYGIVRSWKYGLDRERDVCQYIALMFVFGGNFDLNQDLPAMKAVLDNSCLPDPGKKMTALYAAANDELNRRANRASVEKS
jgi:hypothetical protein